MFLNILEKPPVFSQSFGECHLISVYNGFLFVVMVKLFKTPQVLWNGLLQHWKSHLLHNWPRALCTALLQLHCQFHVLHSSAQPSCFNSFGFPHSLYLGQCSLALFHMTEVESLQVEITSSCHLSSSSLIHVAIIATNAAVSTRIKPASDFNQFRLFHYYGRALFLSKALLIWTYW